MHDPLEGVSPLGAITTGVSRTRVAPEYQPVLDAAAEGVRTAQRDASLYVYGSVATGMARSPTSDVDLLAVGVEPETGDDIGRRLSDRFATLCRAVEVATAQPDDFSPATDAGYGGCVFLKHYCVHVAGPELHSTLPAFPADTRAARGFNGDIARHAARWRAALADGADPRSLSRRLARKTLLAVAGLVSVHDGTWTTDRAGAAQRWSEIDPILGDDLAMLVAWSTGQGVDRRDDIAVALDRVVAEIVASFDTVIGLWDDDSG